MTFERMGWAFCRPCIVCDDWGATMGRPPFWRARWPPSTSTLELLRCDGHDPPLRVQAEQLIISLVSECKLLELDADLTQVRKTLPLLLESSLSCTS